MHRAAALTYIALAQLHVIAITEMAKAYVRPVAVIISG